MPGIILMPGFLVFLLLVGCQPALFGPSIVSRETAVTPIPTAAVPADEFSGSIPSPSPSPPQPGEMAAQPTAGGPVVDPVLVQPSDPRAPVITAAPLSPLELFLPPSQPAAISAWRPPLYPTPWSLTPYDHFFFTRPIAADQISWPLPDYRYGGVFFADVIHTGIDIPASLGTEVFATGPGKVTWAGYGLYALDEDPDDPYGLAVAIKHDFGYQDQTLYTVYGHLDQVFVSKGQHVDGRDLIGLVGETGKVTGPHLHFEVRVGKNNFFGSRNPELWVAPPQGWGVLAGRVMTTYGRLMEKYSINLHAYDTDQYWEVITYGGDSANPDSFYQENLVIGDLPAGEYEIWIPYAGSIYDLDITIRPGLVSYFTFRGKNGYKTELPSLPGSTFSPSFTNP